MSTTGARSRGPGEALDAVGEAAALLFRALLEGRRIRSIGGEVIRQAALVTTGSFLALVTVSLLAGGSCGVEVVAMARQQGIRGAAGGLGAYCALREVAPLAFGYVIALGVGCRLVADMAEAGEDPAREAGPRVLGVLLAAPFAYLVAYALTTVALFAVGIGRFGDVSLGPFFGLFFAFQDDTDLVFSAAKSLLMVVFVLAVALLYGVRAARDPGTSGMAVARFAAVAVIGVTVIGTLGSLVLWGGDPRIPAG